MKPVTKHFIIILLCGIGLLQACKEFIEPDISGRQVSLRAPANNYASSSYAVNFWWDEVEDALTYRLQIVTPDFENAGYLVTDTLIKGDKFTFSLNPGNYQWRVRAENGSYQTSYSEARSLTVLFSSIKQQKVQLKAPANNLITNQNALSFSWGDLYGATKYRLQVDTNNFTDANKVVFEQVTPSLQANFKPGKDQFYQWRVRAENDTAQAQWSSVQTFTYDHTPPLAVNLTAPVNNQNTALPVALLWSQAATASKYKLYLFKSDSTSLYNTNFPVQLTTNSYTLSQGSLGERIYWKVTALDAAGNESNFSPLRSFVLQ